MNTEITQLPPGIIIIRGLSGMGMTLRDLFLFATVALLFAQFTRAHTTAPGDIAVRHYTVIARIPGPDGGWDDASVDTRKHILLLARASGVLSLDLRSRHITSIFVQGRAVHSAITIPGTQLGVSTNGISNTVSLFDSRSGHVLRQIPVGQSPDALVLDRRTALVAVMNHDSGTVSLIDPRQRSLVGTIVVGGTLEVAVSSGTGLIYVNVADKREIAVIDVAARTVRARFALRGCDDPSGLALDHKTISLITVCANGVTKFLRATDGREFLTVRTGHGSDGVILDERRRRLFVPSGRDGKLTVFSMKGIQPRIIQVLNIPPGTRLGAVDPDTGNVYLPSAHLGPPKPPSPWPSIVPGSFHFLVVGR